MNKWNDDAGAPQHPDQEQQSLFVVFGDVLVRAVMRIGVPEADAEALVQEALIACLWEDPPEGEKKAWLIAAATTRASTYLELRGLPARGDVAQETRAVEHLDLRRRELATLTERVREALRLRVSEKKSFAEIAEELGVSEFAAKKMVEKALRTLRRG